jgi:hypothetical protein
MLLPLHMNMLLQTAAASTAEAGTTIANANATSVLSSYEICQRTGFRQYPTWDPLSKMRIQWDGLGVRADSLDHRHPQDFVKSRGNDHQEGPQNPESDDMFLTATIAPEDL